MKFHLQRPTANVVTAMGPGWVRVGDTEYRENIVVLPDAVMPGWAPNGFTALGEPDFASLLSYKPEMVLLGTGSKQLFPHPRLLQLYRQRASASRSWTPARRAARSTSSRPRIAGWRRR